MKVQRLGISATARAVKTAHTANARRASAKAIRIYEKAKQFLAKQGYRDPAENKQNTTLLSKALNTAHYTASNAWSECGKT